MNSIFEIIFDRIKNSQSLNVLIMGAGDINGDTDRWIHFFDQISDMYGQLPSFVHLSFLAIDNRDEILDRLIKIKCDFNNSDMLRDKLNRKKFDIILFDASVIKFAYWSNIHFIILRDSLEDDGLMLLPFENCGAQHLDSTESYYNELKNLDFRSILFKFIDFNKSMSHHNVLPIGGGLLFMKKPIRCCANFDIAKDKFVQHASRCVAESLNEVFNHVIRCEAEYPLPPESRCNAFKLKLYFELRK